MSSDKRNIENPHETRPFKDNGHMDVITLGDFTLGRGVFEPGWRWSNDVKPIAGTDSCQTRHTGYCVSGQMTVRFEDGEEITRRSGRRDAHRAGPRRLDRRRRAVRPARHRHRRLRQAQLTDPRQWQAVVPLSVNDWPATGTNCQS